jgi:hypothetical protein
MSGGRCLWCGNVAASEGSSGCGKSSDQKSTLGFQHILREFLHPRWTRIDPAQLAPQPQGMECGGKRSATPLSEAGPRSESGVAAVLCHRSPNFCRPCAELHDCSTEGGRVRRHKPQRTERTKPGASCPRFPGRYSVLKAARAAANQGVRRPRTVLNPACSK